MAIKPPSQQYSPLALCFCLEYQLSYLHLFSSNAVLFLQALVVVLTPFPGANTAHELLSFQVSSPRPQEPAPRALRFGKDAAQTVPGLLSLPKICVRRRTLNCPLHPVFIRQPSINLFPYSYSCTRTCQRLFYTLQGFYPSFCLKQMLYIILAYVTTL